MQLIYGQELSPEDMTLREIHELKQKTGIEFVFDGCRPVAIKVPCYMPGMDVILALK